MISCLTQFWYDCRWYTAVMLFWESLTINLFCCSYIRMCWIHSIYLHDSKCRNKLWFADYQHQFILFLVLAHFFFVSRFIIQYIVFQTVFVKAAVNFQSFFLLSLSAQSHDCRGSSLCLCLSSVGLFGRTSHHQSSGIGSFLISDVVYQNRRISAGSRADWTASLWRSPSWLGKVCRDTTESQMLRHYLHFCTW